MASIAPFDGLHLWQRFDANIDFELKKYEQIVSFASLQILWVYFSVKRVISLQLKVNSLSLMIS
jgi:hypothetical protein